MKKYLAAQKTAHSQALLPYESIFGSRVTLPARLGVAALAAGAFGASLAWISSVYDMPFGAIQGLITALIGIHAFAMATAHEQAPAKLRRHGLLGSPETRSVRITVSTLSAALVSAPTAWDTLTHRHPFIPALYSLSLCIGLYCYYAATMNDHSSKNSDILGDPGTLRSRLRHTGLLLAIYAVLFGGIWLTTRQSIVPSYVIIPCVMSGVYWTFYKTK
ncbi:hypothetical protein CCAX7_55590 [Capsulimonas corticalis]|uniref:Uncharacterized protein n=1 Tax=Capsulimonas corticalis TaxID=2219043 RepID=A0A402D0S7_9BACT|nr:hypothetical protein [Capsulimonas corticalis]BDI33508.1 hypothetical protein CCAX7_55590 [Capsulimonas corticalis]